MKIHPLKTIFDAKFPTLEEHEEEIFYRHPVFPFCVNQIGIFYFDDDDAEARWVTINKVWGVWRYREIGQTKKGYKNGGTRLKLAYECFTGIYHEDTKQYLPLDGNPYNLTFENIIPVAEDKKKTTEARKVKLKIYAETAKYMLEKDKKSKGTEKQKEERWQQIVPLSYFNAYKIAKKKSIYRR